MAVLHSASSKSSVSLSDEFGWMSLMLCQDETLKKNVEEELVQQGLVTLVVVEERELAIISRCYAD